MHARSALIAISFGLQLLAEAPAKIVLVAGTPSHRPGAHEFNAGVLLLEKCLLQNEGVLPVAVRNGWPSDESVFNGAKAIVLYMDGRENHDLLKGDHLASLGVLMRKGVGLGLLHFALDVPKDHGGPELLEWVGGYYEADYSQNPMAAADLTQASPAHPVSRGWKNFQALDEWYYHIRFRPADKRVTPILTLTPKGASEPEAVAWVTQRTGGGRGFGFSGGHLHRNWGIPEFRRVVVNAILWIADVDVPASGARCDIAEENLKKNLDVKPMRRRPN